MKTMVRNTAKSLITDRTYITKTNEYTLCIYCIQYHTVYAKHMQQQYFSLTRVGKYLLVLNCFRKLDRKTVPKNKMADQKRTSGV